MHTRTLASTRVVLILVVLCIILVQQVHTRTKVLASTIVRALYDPYTT